MTSMMTCCIYSVRKHEFTCTGTKNNEDFFLKSETTDLEHSFLTKPCNLMCQLRPHDFKLLGFAV